MWFGVLLDSWLMGLMDSWDDRVGLLGMARGCRFVGGAVMGVGVVIGVVSVALCMAGA